MTRFELKALFVLIMACVLFACGGQTANNRTELKIASWGTNKDVSIYNKLIETFRAQHDNTNLTLVFIPWGNYFTKLQLLIIGNVAPDIVTISVDMAHQLKSNGHLINLQPFIEKERQSNPGFLRESDYIIDAFKPMCEFEGETYYLPVGPMMFHLYYNQDLFDAAGVEYPQGQWNWEDLRTAAQKLTVRNSEGRVEQWGFMVENWWQWWTPFLWQNGAELFDDMQNPARCLLDSPQAIETFQFFQDLTYRDKVVPTPMQMSQMSGNFMTGKLAMRIHGSWMVEQYRNIKTFRWDMAPLTRQKQYANLMTIGGYALSSQCKDPAMAWEFIKMFTQPEAQTLMCDDCTLWIPTKRSVIAQDPMKKVTGLPEHHDLRYTEIDRSRPGSIRHPQAKRLLQAIHMGVEPIFIGKQSPQECLPKVVEEVNAILAEKPVETNQ